MLTCNTTLCMFFVCFWSKHCIWGWCHQLPQTRFPPSDATPSNILFSLFCIFLQCEKMHQHCIWRSATPAMHSGWLLFAIYVGGDKMPGNKAAKFLECQQHKQHHSSLNFKNHLIFLFKNIINCPSGCFLCPCGNCCSREQCHGHYIAAP